VCVVVERRADLTNARVEPRIALYVLSRPQELRQLTATERLACVLHQVDEQPRRLRGQAHSTPAAEQLQARGIQEVFPEVIVLIELSPFRRSVRESVLGL
jgi:hypothetical protein